MLPVGSLLRLHASCKKLSAVSDEGVCVWKKRFLLFFRYWKAFVQNVQNNVEGPFHGHLCDQKSGNFHFWMATAPGAILLSTSF